MKKEVLLVFQRNAVLGKVKTRLAAEVGEQLALEIYFHLLSLTYEQIHSLPVSLWVWFSDFLPELLPDPFHRMFLQQGSDLGMRMKDAFQTSFALGVEKLVLIGTDCPELEEKHIRQAFAFLDRSDVVLGPARDGGYYLIGLKYPQDFLFEGITWSSSLVLAQTLAEAKKNNLVVDLLPVLDDIDTLVDWERYLLANTSKPQP